MNIFEGFFDEIEKLGGLAGAALGAGKFVAKHPWSFLNAALIGAGGLAGVQAAKAARGSGRAIASSSQGPSKAWYVDYHKALGLPKRMSKLEEQNLSRNFARYRGRE
jgi:hypothetical protein